MVVLLIGVKYKMDSINISNIIIIFVFFPGADARKTVTIKAMKKRKNTTKNSILPAKVNKPNVKKVGVKDLDKV